MDKCFHCEENGLLITLKIVMQTSGAYSYPSLRASRSSNMAAEGPRVTMLSSLTIRLLTIGSASTAGTAEMMADSVRI